LNLVSMIDSVDPSLHEHDNAESIRLQQNETQNEIKPTILIMTY